ncbi:3'-5' exonuclease [bacterium]|nr:3'-5' exonuclease [bacterium]
MFLFFDTETTGLPLDWQAPLENLDNWPRLVQLAWLLTDEKGNKVKGASKIIKPEGFIIPEGAAAVHGISTKQAQKEGILLNTALKEFIQAVDEAKILVAHNMSFDEKIMGAELLRKKHEHKLFERPQICTMLSSTNYCRIDNGYGYKWPKLVELHFKLFDEEFEGAHDALADVKACARCFFELMKRKVIQ